jgi:hypothetical protein
MTRRRFAFWLGFGLFSLSDTLRISGLDSLAAAAMEGSERRAKKSVFPEHWSTADDKTWTWLERENLIDGQWVLTGTTRPVHKETGELKEASEVYLPEHLVPGEMRPAPSDLEEPGDEIETEAAPLGEGESDEGEPLRLPMPSRRARHGRPPSKWLRSLDADELRIWLKTVEVPEAGVSGMTYWEHLTRDHAFLPENLENLEITHQAKLHAAAHFGY